MKSTGTIRKVDNLGRIVIPSEVRSLWEIETGDALEIYTEGDCIILKKYEPNMECIVTGEASEENIRVADRNIVLSPEGAQQLMREIQQINLDDK